jgi:hypothetical protein
MAEESILKILILNMLIFIQALDGPMGSLLFIVSNFPAIPVTTTIFLRYGTVDRLNGY